MRLPIYQVDAFTDSLFGGNPAAVCPLDAWLPDATMQAIAAENNLSETAFFVREGGDYALRWFTPTVEVKLCGHATLASAFTLWETGVLAPDQIARFHTLSGWLTCRRTGEWIEMDFPAQVPELCPTPESLSESLGAKLLWVGSNGMDYLVEVADEKALRALKPNFSTLAKLPVRGVIVTCRSESAEFDFLSRFFAPAAGVNEDPVTGSAHCALGPYWQAKLGKSDFTAYQASERGGIVKVGVRGERVRLRGQAVMMSKVELLA